jgi:hypothetical protein
MELTLFYDELWNQEPLARLKDEVLRGSPPEQPPVLPIHRKQYEFAPLVHSKLRLVAELHITMLLPGPPGQIIRRGGDIDNRLKTLLDALTVPDQNQAPLILASSPSSACSKTTS